MKTAIVDFGGGFHVLMGDGASQAATMVLDPKRNEGGPNNRHKGADQWLYVEDGHGEAVIEGRSIVLRPGSLLLIQKGETHEIRNTGEEPLRTLNIYIPAAYTDDGDELPAGEST